MMTESTRVAVNSVDQACSAAVTAASSRRVSVRGRCWRPDATLSRRRGRLHLEWTFQREQTPALEFGDSPINCTRLKGCKVPVPKGLLRLAQRFNVGWSVSYCLSPEGTAELSRVFAVR